MAEDDNDRCEYTENIRKGLTALFRQELKDDRYEEYIHDIDLVKYLAGRAAIEAISGDRAEGARRRKPTRGRGRGRSRARGHTRGRTRGRGRVGK